jgi:hypothetical protein
MFLENADYFCKARHTARINRRPPVISRVCRESRAVALEHVDLRSGKAPPVPQGYDFGTFMGPVDWVDKQRDVLHLNYDEAYDAEFLEGDGVFEFLLGQAAAKARDASLTDDFYCQLIHNPVHMYTIRNKRLLVSLGVVAVHAPLQPALESGLFGLLGDARVVLVDADDTERMELYRSFWEKHGLPSDIDPHPPVFFNRFCRQGIKVWVRGNTEDLRFNWLVHQWSINEERIADADEAWIKKPLDDWDDEKEPWTWQRYVPNPEHPWMREALEAMPEVHSTLMVRLCTQRCPIEYASAKPLRQ